MVQESPTDVVPARSEMFFGYLETNGDERYSCGRFKEALRLADRITQRKTNYYPRIRHDPLVGELQFSALTDAIRPAFMREVGELRQALARRGRDRGYSWKQIDSATPLRSLRD